MRDVILNVEIYTEDDEQFVFISHDNGSGCHYEINHAGDVGYYVTKYIENYVE